MTGPVSPDSACAPGCLCRSLSGGASVKIATLPTGYSREWVLILLYIFAYQLEDMADCSVGFPRCVHFVLVTSVLWGWLCYIGVCLREVCDKLFYFICAPNVIFTSYKLPGYINFVMPTQFFFTFPPRRHCCLISPGCTMQTPHLYV